jgi:hypothetical protein
VTWLVPRACRRLSLAQIEAELLRAMGNVTLAAEALGVPAIALNAMVRAVPALEDARIEGLELAVDRAEAVVIEGLRSSELNERMSAAGYLLEASPAAKRRGWGRNRIVSEPSR